MTRDGVIYLLELRDIAYGKNSRSMTRGEMERTISLYMDVMSDIPDEIAAFALKQHIRTSKFPPTPSEILDKAKIAVESTQMGGDEAYIRESWEAIRGSRKFEDLSEVGKEYWRSQEAIDAVGYDPNTIYTVFRGQMMRALPAIKERIRVRKEMPEGIRNLIDQLFPSPEFGKTKIDHTMQLEEDAERVRAELPEPTEEKMQEIRRRWIKGRKEAV